MVTVTEIVEDSQQAHGRRIKVKLTFDNGEEQILRVNGLSASDDNATVNAAIAALIPDAEAGVTYREKERFVQAVAEGVDPDTIPLTYNNKDLLLVETFKRAMNLMLDAKDADAWGRLHGIAPLADSFTNVQIATAIGWTTQEVVSSKAKLATLYAAMEDIGHGKERFDDVGQ
jgi:hypothetical protein